MILVLHHYQHLFTAQYQNIKLTTSFILTSTWNSASHLLIRKLHYITKICNRTCDKIKDAIFTILFYIQQLTSLYLSIAYAHFKITSYSIKYSNSYMHPNNIQIVTKTTMNLVWMGKRRWKGHRVKSTIPTALVMRDPIYIYDPETFDSWH